MTHDQARTWKRVSMMEARYAYKKWLETADEVWLEILKSNIESARIFSRCTWRHK